MSTGSAFRPCCCTRCRGSARPTAPWPWAWPAYGACALLVVVLMAALGGALRWTREERAGGSLSASLGNSAFLGLPIAAAVLGPEAARLSAGAVAVDFVVVAAVGVGLLGWAGGGRPGAR